jgi:RNA polymerase sigma factor (sigma-70 family)
VRSRHELTHLSDEALVALVARSSEDALAEIYDRFGGVAYGLALRIVRDRSLAEDVVQDAFLTVWRSAPRFVPERAKAGTWILTLVHRRAVDVVRRQERRRAEPLREGFEPAAGGSAADSAWSRLERERVQAALRRLPDQQREALELAYYGGFTQSELAERLGLPLGTIKSRMFNGLGRLRELLAEPEQEETRWSARKSTS